MIYYFLMAVCLYFTFEQSVILTAPNATTIQPLMLLPMKYKPTVSFQNIATVKYPFLKATLEWRLPRLLTQAVSILCGSYFFLLIVIYPWELITFLYVYGMFVNVAFYSVFAKLGMYEQDEATQHIDQLKEYMGYLNELDNCDYPYRVDIFGYDVRFHVFEEQITEAGIVDYDFKWFEEETPNEAFVHAAFCFKSEDDAVMFKLGM
jgi:hypothetical protein